MNLAQVTVVHRERPPPLALLHVASTQNPATPQRRQSFTDFTAKVRIAPWSASVVDANVCVFKFPAIRQAGGGLGNLPQTHSHIGVDLACDVNPAAAWIK